MTRTKVMLTVVLMGALFAFGGSTTASAQDDCGYGGCVTTTTGGATTVPDDIPTITVVRGETIDVSGEGCAPGAEVVVTYDDGTVLGTFTADENGDFTTASVVVAVSVVWAETVPWANSKRPIASTADLTNFIGRVSPR